MTGGKVGRELAGDLRLVLCGSPGGKLRQAHIFPPVIDRVSLSEVRFLLRIISKAE